eukprot:2155330-Amphidinium_carterae.1
MRTSTTDAHRTGFKTMMPQADTIPAPPTTAAWPELDVSLSTKHEVKHAELYKDSARYSSSTLPREVGERTAIGTVANGCTVLQL